MAPFLWLKRLSLLTCSRTVYGYAIAHMHVEILQITIFRSLCFKWLCTDLLHVGKEVFRTDGYLKAFHVQSTLDYVSSGAYKTQPEFQRFIEDRADKLLAQGIEVDIMK